MKTCVNCNKELSLVNFSLSTKSNDGYQTKCKLCVNTYNKEYYLVNKEKIKNSCKMYKSKNLNEIKKKNKDYAIKNKDKMLQYKKTYYKNNIEKYKQYGIDNRERLSTQSVKLVLHKLKTDPIYRLQFNIRSRIRAAFRLKKATKCKKSEELLGCSIKIAKEHLETKFLPTMTWENYGKYWHIDHIIPCSSFDLSIEEEQKKCFHYTNLQPLFAVTQIINGIEYIGNLNKGDKLLN
jgi:hypothetical protein